jgi:putative methionine-R-sulfoxide reductase with GAF domain
MPAAPRTLASLAFALGAAADREAALLAFADSVAELDRGAQVALFRYDPRRQALVDRVAAVDGRAERAEAETRLEHLPGAVHASLHVGARFADLAERSAEFARLFGFATPLDGTLALRGVRAEGQLVAVLAVREPRRIFGARLLDRVEPAAALLDLALARFWEREARGEAVDTLETVTRRVHGEYVRKLAALEAQLAAARGTPALGSVAIPPRPAAPPAARDAVEAERRAAQQLEAVRRAERRAEVVEQQLAASAQQVEQAQAELHRRGESLRQTERTLYLLDRVLALDAVAHDDARQLVDELLALVGDDMQAQRCSLMLRAPEPGELYLAAARGVAPHVVEGSRIRVGEGVAGRVALSREPVLVRDVRDAGAHPLLSDQYFTAGSFISFPLVYHGELVGVVNLTNRATRGPYAEADVERVRLLAMVISLVATHARLPERLVTMLAAPA